MPCRHDVGVLVSVQTNVVLRKQNGDGEGIFLEMIPFRLKESGIIPLNDSLESKQIKGIKESKANFKESSPSHQNEQ